MFYNIRTDLDKLQCASNITKIVNEVTTENQNTYRVLQLYLNTLYTISETDKNLSLVTSTFVLRLLSIIGYKPIIEECQNCKTKDDLNYFSFKDNGLKCKTCGKLDKGAIEITDTTKDAIRYIILANPKKLFSFNVPQESIKELQIISKIYLQEKLEKEFSGNGRVLIRPSGTEPLVRVMIEGEDQGYIKTKAEALAKLIEQKLK